MRNVVVLLFVGCLFLSCKNESQADISIHKVYTPLELIEKLKAVMTENDSVGQLIVTDLARANGYLPVIETKDTAMVREYVAKLDFGKPTTCAFVPLNNHEGGVMHSLIVYEQTPLIIETVTLSISLRENQEYLPMPINGSVLHKKMLDVN